MMLRERLAFAACGDFFLWCFGGMLSPLFLPMACFGSVDRQQEAVVSNTGYDKTRGGVCGHSDKRWGIY